MNDQMKKSSPLSATPEPHELDDAYRRLLAAVETMQLGVTVTDIDGKIVFTNSADARMHGYTVEELIGQDVSVFCLPGYRRSLTSGQLREMRSWRRESMNVRKDGTVFPVALMSDVVLDSRGEPIGVVTTCEDLTPVKRAEAERERLRVQIQQSQKLESLGMLAGGIARDLDNLVTSILGNASGLLLHLPTEASPILNKVVDIQKETLRLAELTNQLLAIAGEAQRSPEAVVINDIVKDLVHLVEITKPPHVQLRYELGDQLPPAQADPAHLRQVIRHLITNASEAIGEEGGTVTIRTGAKWVDRDFLTTTYLGDDASQGQYVFLEVKDTGRGLDPAMKDKVFDPFFTTKSSGQGIGLAAVIGIMKAHRGVIRVDAPPEHGTSIAILLPTEAATQNHAEEVLDSQR
jgi:two-component system cell cycle sensor histidine kinase/response regulator CckA